MPGNDNIMQQITAVPLTAMLPEPPPVENAALGQWLSDLRRVLDENAEVVARSLSAVKTAVTEPIIEITASTYDVTDDDYIILADATTAAITLTLPPPADVLNHVFTIKRLNSGANSVTIDVAGGGTIDEGTSCVLIFQYDAIRITSDGTEYWIF